MYKLVETFEEKMRFKHLYQAFILEEKGISYFEENGVQQYLFFQKENPIGTVEFQLLESDRGYALMKIFNPFLNNALNQVMGQNIFILGKLSLIKEYRGKGYFLNLLEVIYEHHLNNSVDWYTGVLNKPVYEMLYRKGFIIEKISREIEFGSITLVPFLIDARQAAETFSSIKKLRDQRGKQKLIDEIPIV